MTAEEAAGAAGSPAPRGTTTAGRPATLRNVQALRAIAALLVVFVHLSGAEGFEARYLGPSWTTFLHLSGNGGVDLFFVISGLIMTVTTWRSFDAAGSARRFLWRRVTRIYPLYWLITTPILVLYLVSPGSVNSHADAPPDILASYLLLPQAGLPLLLVGWTLVYEMYFYLIFALGMLLGRRWFGPLIGVWSAVTITLSLLLRQTGNPWLGLAGGLLSLEFVFGVVVGTAVVHRRMPWARAVLAVGVAAVIVSFAYLAGKPVFPSEAFRVFGVGLPMALVVYGAVGVEMRHGFVLPGFLQRWGDASYSLYLIHVPALTVAGMVISKVVSPNLPVHVIGIVALPAGLIFAAQLSYRFVEHPLQKFFHHWPARTAPAPAAVPAGAVPAAAVPAATSPAPAGVPAGDPAAQWYAVVHGRPVGGVVTRGQHDRGFTAPPYEIPAAAYDGHQAVSSAATPSNGYHEVEYQDRSYQDPSYQEGGYRAPVTQHNAYRAAEPPGWQDDGDQAYWAAGRQEAEPAPVEPERAWLSPYGEPMVVDLDATNPFGQSLFGGWPPRSGDGQRAD